MDGLSDALFKDKNFKIIEESLLNNKKYKEILESEEFFQYSIDYFQKKLDNVLIEKYSLIKTEAIKLKIKFD